MKADIVTLFYMSEPNSFRRYLVLIIAFGLAIAKLRQVESNKSVTV